MKKDKKKESFWVMFTSKFTKRSEQINKIIHQHWHILRSDARLESHHNPPLTGFKRGRNLRDYLVRSDLPLPSKVTQRTLTPISNYCWGSCNQCNYKYRCTSFKHLLQE